MADITIRLRYNLETGKKDIFVDFVSDEDALPIEHEQDHKRIIEQLLGKGILHTDEVGEIKVQRVSSQKAPQSQRQQQTEVEELSAGES